MASCDATAVEKESRIEVRGIPQLVNPNEVAKVVMPSRAPTKLSLSKARPRLKAT